MRGLRPTELRGASSRGDEPSAQTRLARACIFNFSCFIVDMQLTRA